MRILPMNRDSFRLSENINYYHVCLSLRAESRIPLLVQIVGESTILGKTVESSYFVAVEEIQR